MAYIGGNNTLPSACDQFTYGEVEDYCVNIIQGTICGMNVSSTVSDPQCSGVDNGSISVNVTGGTAGYSYDWGSSFGNSSSISGLAPGNYSLTISDAALCDTTVNYSLTYQTTSMLIYLLMTSAVMAQVMEQLMLLRLVVLTTHTTGAQDSELYQASPDYLQEIIL